MRTYGFKFEPGMWDFGRRLLLVEFCFLLLTVLWFATEDFTRYTPGLPQELGIAVYFIVLTASGATVRTDDGLEPWSPLFFVLIWLTPIVIGVLARRHGLGRRLAYLSLVVRYVFGFAMAALAAT